jgi:hypothetical protein
MAHLYQEGMTGREHLRTENASTEDNAMQTQKDLTGRWAVCGHGRIGVIEGRKHLSWGDSWIGTGIDGQPWASQNPRLLNETDSQVVAGFFEEQQRAVSHS